jgi:hypothetical protein
MNHCDNTSAPASATLHRRKTYTLPAIVVELDLETWAGTSVTDPFQKQDPSQQGLDNFNSK